MVKVITITDEAYKKLKKIKIRRRESFTDTILFLIRVYEKIGAKEELENLAGSLKVGFINKKFLKRVIKNG